MSDLTATFGFGEDPIGTRNEIPFLPTKEKPFSVGVLSSAKVNTIKTIKHGEITNLVLSFTRKEEDETIRYFNHSVNEVDLNTAITNEKKVKLLSAQLIEILEFYTGKKGKAIVNSPAGIKHNLIGNPKVTIAEFLQNYANFVNTGNDEKPIYEGHNNHWLNLSYWLGSSSGKLQFGDSPFLEKRYKINDTNINVPKFLAGKDCSYVKPEPKMSTNTPTSNNLPKDVDSLEGFM